ncbi:MAG TPA: Holliday junction branch migration protein RuvA [Planctomycetota bacterium]|nr:Holliday junction branch migration protein RuvA [Planctomycetota bacterium]
MYDYLEGKVELHAATRLVLDVGGVGYELSVPLGSDFGTGRRRVFTHLAVREDAHTLFGFADAATRELFRALITVKGVGPRMALGVLSGLPRNELVAAITGGDRTRLQAVKGVGRKTADQILLDLGEKAGTLLAAAGGTAPALPTAAGGAGEDAVAALVSIGYADRDARKQVERAAEKVGSDDLEALVRAALSS